MKLKGFLVGCAVVLVMAASGCLGTPSGWFEPETNVSYSPLWGLKVHDTKDNDIDAEGSYDPETKKLDFKFTIRNNASDVNESQLALMQEHREQMAVYNEQMRIHGENIVNAFGMLNQLAGIVVGGATDIFQTTVGPDGLRLGKAAGNPAVSEPEPQPDPESLPK